MNEKNDLIVTIFTYNRPEYVAANLLGLKGQTFNAFDIMIVDDASPQIVRENPMVANIISRLEDEGHKVYHHRMAENGGISKARKEATKNINKNWKYCFDLNDDHFLEPDCIEKMMATITMDEKIGVVGSCTPMIFWDRSTLIRNYDDFKLKLNKITFNSGGGPEFNRGVDYVYLKEGRMIVTPITIDHASQFIYRTGIVSVEDLPSGYSNVGFTEETDFSLRFRKAGYLLMFQPNAINWHMLSPKGGIRAVSPLDRTDACKNDWCVFINNWKQWLEDNHEKNNQ
jgi:GT2 family glycosyltransferase